MKPHSKENTPQHWISIATQCLCDSVHPGKTQYEGRLEASVRFHVLTAPGFAAMTRREQEYVRGFCLGLQVAHSRMGGKPIHQVGVKGSTT